MEIHDRILEAYQGKMGESFMRETHRRIHWVCRQVLGNDILDVGCSQGIVPVLLGREGKRVLGVDLDPLAVEEANAFLEIQHENVREKVRFECADFMTVDYGDRRFDTVILTEVLEHLVDPAKFVEKAHSLLKDGGCLVVTVPFGINDFIDHKSTFYLSGPYRILSRFFSLSVIEFMGKWIGFQCIKGEVSDALVLDTPLLSTVERLETAFMGIERQLVDDKKSKYEALTKANALYRESSTDNVNLKARVEEAVRKSAEIENRLKSELEGNKAQSELIREQLKEANEKYRKSTEQVAQLKEKMGDLLAFEKLSSEREKRLVFLEQELERVNGRSEAFYAELKEANEKYRKSTEQVAQLKEKVGELETARASVVSEREALCTQLAEVEQCWQSSEATAGQLRTRIEELETARASVVSEREALCTQLADSGQELASVYAGRDEAQKLLNEANLKYRQVTAQVTQLKDKLQEQQVALFKARSSYRDASVAVVDLKKGRNAAVAELRSLRSSISYRLGRIITTAMRSPREWPSSMRRLWMLFKDARRAVKSRSANKKAPAEDILSVDMPEQKEVSLPTAPKPKPPADRVYLDPSKLKDGISGLRIACILDEFSFASYAPEASFTQLTPENWARELEACQPDLLFVESAWRGKDDLWGSKVGHCASELQGIVAWCRAKAVPTAFWNKEDPVHFETFINTAHLFDYVFTTDIDCIHRYKGILGHDRVHLLPFACQPRQHNPIETYPRKDAFCFAGAYYVRYPERTADLSRMVSDLSSWRPFEIYDRNYGKTDPNYQFPPEYGSFIVGHLPFEQIDKAYKGYRYAINLNSIKQSQSMFARRVYELLGSNTVTVSNYSRGVRLLFGDLVMCSDEPGEILRRLKSLDDGPDGADPLRLAALRKVMTGHTYAHRLSSAVSAMLSDGPVSVALPQVVLVGKAETEAEACAVIAAFDRQSYESKSLLLVCPVGVVGRLKSDRGDIHFLDLKEAGSKTLLELLPRGVRVCGICAGDFYGSHYVEDLVIATTYSEARVIGKGRRFSLKNGSELVVDEGSEYQWVDRLPIRSAMLPLEDCGSVSAMAWLASLPDAIVQGKGLLATDRFNYCFEGAKLSVQDAERVSGALSLIRPGIGFEQLESFACRIGPEKRPTQDIPFWSGADLAARFRLPETKPFSGKLTGAIWELESRLQDGVHEYVYASKDVTLSSIAGGRRIELYLETTPGLNIQLALAFMDSTGARVGSVVKGANRNESVDVPDGTDRVRLGIRIYASGNAGIKGIYWGKVSRMPAAVVPMQRHLIVTNQYPSYDNLYRNGFVHSRVRSYRAMGTAVDVFRFGPDSIPGFREFEGVDVVSGDSGVLDMMLASGQYDHVMVHFLSPGMWNVLQKHVDHIRVTVWVHGFEVQPFHRREYNYSTEEERQKAIQESEARIAFWRGVFRALPPQLRFVFVSRYFADEVIEDVGLPLPEAVYSVIPNPIDSRIFCYEKKDPEQRKRILSIRPFASRQYGNDLSVEAIRLLSKQPFFKELEFRIIGDGILFDETLEPIRDYPNVKIERRFLPQSEIAALHKEYGIFLCPTRWDSHGVSRDEAMASGLVPVTNRVAAIPEFVDEDNGILADPDDAAGLAAGIVSLQDPAVFSAMSARASERVAKDRESGLIIGRELAIIRGVAQNGVEA